MTTTYKTTTTADHIVITKPGLLYATSLHVSKEETRYYLQVVRIQRAPAHVGGLLFIATDGHTMSVGHDADGTMPDGMNEAHYRATPKDWKSCTAKHVVRVTLEPGTLRTWSGEAPKDDFDGYLIGQTIATEESDNGSYPAWERVAREPLKADGDGKAITIDARYQARMADTAAAIGHDTGRKRNQSAPIRYTSADGGIASVRLAGAPHWRGIVMGMRAGDMPSATPEWLPTDGLADTDVETSEAAD